MQSKTKCSTPYCRNDRVKGRTKCSKCNMRWLKEHHLDTYTFNILRCNAKRRGKIFNITLNQFRKFCKETNYLELKGKNASSASIDCKIPEKGYSYENMQILTLAENTIKENKRRKCPF